MTSWQRQGAQKGQAFLPTKRIFGWDEALFPEMPNLDWYIDKEPAELAELCKRAVPYHTEQKSCSRTIPKHIKHEVLQGITQYRGNLELGRHQGLRNISTVLGDSSICPPLRKPAAGTAHLQGMTIYPSGTVLAGDGSTGARWLRLRWICISRCSHKQAVCSHFQQSQ